MIKYLALLMLGSRMLAVNAADISTEIKDPKEKQSLQEIVEKSCLSWHCVATFLCLKDKGLTDVTGIADLKVWLKGHQQPTEAQMEALRQALLKGELKNLGDILRLGIDLSYNKISSLPAEIRQFTNLVYLVLDSNWSLKEFPADIL